ncbi:undecaprenyl-diphosphatase [Geomonas oryzae]|uniref:undecaprenyl-diphosphatase n=1 Tax=Geomonas oryzae TaxID=2364273 RepID=UPI00100A6F47|nr:undecaprenyl-diphosphatase [Geomonas oryzae]
MLDADLTLFHLINGLAGKSAVLDTAMVCIAKYGPLLFALILLRTWFGTSDTPEAKMANRTAVMLAIFSAMIGLGMNQLVGHLYFRPRPYAEHTVSLLLDRSPDPSFPSDHSTGGFSLASSLFLADKKTGALSLGFAAVLAFSRVYAGAHYPLDVVGGAVTGILATALVNASSKRLEPATRLVLKVWDKKLRF